MILLIAAVSLARAETRITENPDGTLLIEITGEARPAGDAHPGPDGAAPPPADPSRAASLQAEIRRLESERDFVLIRTGTETPEESLEKRRMANRKFQEINRLTAERLQLQFGGEGAGGR
jgi:uncharacterized small protein (DUF1192 family)